MRVEPFEVYRGKIITPLFRIRLLLDRLGARDRYEMLDYCRRGGPAIIERVRSGRAL
jgi:hypothetical protein